jgi:LPXTG-motif cell wall-anchored protein
VTLRRSLYAATLILAVTLAWVLLAAHPARADYSDHGIPDVSTVASTHPQTYTPGGLPDTGADVTSPLVLAAVLFVAGLAAVLLSRKPHHRRTT